jgi:ABC-type glycerol-3-phosphate transport system substrate-binding protein
MLPLKNMLTIVLLLAVAACGGLPGPGTATVTAPVLTAAATAEATAALTEEPAPATPVAETGPITLRVWLPPEFTPDTDTPSGRILAEQISVFEAAHPDVAVEVRLKAASGPGGLLNALVTAANVAPTVLPNLVVLRRDDLATVAAGGLVTPLDNLLPVEALADYYPFAQAIGRANGAWVGLPFAADARVVAYLTNAYSNPPLRWDDLTVGTLSLPGTESSGLTVLSAYLAEGGTLADDEGQVRLEADVLAQTLERFQGLRAAGVLQPAGLDYADTAATWQVFRDRRTTLAVTSAQLYMTEYFRVEGAAATLLPTAGEPPIALADGWSWAVVNVAPEHFALCAELLAWLTAPEQQAPWTEAANVLPTRAGTLAAWRAQRLVPFVSDVVTHAQLQPSAATLAVVGPPLRQALSDVLSGRATPFAAATVAADMVEQP